LIHCVFTLDYEIYGEGHGALRDLVYEPAEKLRRLFLGRGVRFVNFVEVAEIERIDEVGSDQAIALVKRQVRELHEDGFETALHLHPQWYNGVYAHGQWELDRSEYNLCKLPRARVSHIVDRSLAYLTHLVGASVFRPVSFRAGNWLLQPTHTSASVLAERGLRIDSSVFKGGVQHRHGLDYRPAQRNGRYWRFERDVNVADDSGRLIEVPIHTQMMPFWRMATKKRMSFPSQANANKPRDPGRVKRLRDFLRLRYPQKLDFCRMTLNELTSMMDQVVQEDRADPSGFRPVVAIGHTKDMVDLDTVEAFLSYLEAHSVRVSTFADILPRLDSILGARENRPRRE